MKGINLMDAFSDFKELKDIDRETMNNILDEVFRSMILKRWGADDGFDIIINPDRGDLEIWRTRQIVEDGELDDEVAQIEVSAIFWPCVRIFSHASWIWRKITFTRNIVSA
jgi:N utilization substance protein A